MEEEENEEEVWRRFGGGEESSIRDLERKASSLIPGTMSMFRLPPHRAVPSLPASLSCYPLHCNVSRGVHSSSPPGFLSSSFSGHAICSISDIKRHSSQLWLVERRALQDPARYAGCPLPPQGQTLGALPETSGCRSLHRKRGRLGVGSSKNPTTS